RQNAAPPNHKQDHQDCHHDSDLAQHALLPFLRRGCLGGRTEDTTRQSKSLPPSTSGRTVRFRTVAALESSTLGRRDPSHVQAHSARTSGWPQYIGPLSILKSVIQQIDSLDRNVSEASQTENPCPTTR